MSTKGKLVYIINVDWYFILHWKERALAAQQYGFEIHVITHFTDAANVNTLKRLGFFLHNIKLSRKGLNLFSDVVLFINIYGHLKRISPTLVHTVTIKPNIYANLASRLQKLPTIASVTGLGSLYYATSAKYVITRLLVTTLLKCALRKRKLHVLFENNHDRDFMIRKKIVSAAVSSRIFGSGINLKTFPFSQEPSSNKVIVLYASRLLKSKGLEDLVTATQIAKKRNANIELHVAGIIDNDTHDAITMTQLQSWIATGLIHWLGEVRRMAPLIASSHIVVLPNRFGEGIPRILIEAGATGRPSITTNTPGSNELITNNYNGLIVEPYAVDQLADAIVKLAFDKSLRYILGRQAHEHIANHYTNDHVITQTLSTYNQLLSTVTTL